MRKLILPLIAIVLTVTAAALLAACTDTDEEASTAAPSSETPPATQPPGGAGGGGDGVLVPITTPFPSPAPVPEDWPTYTNPKGRFTVRYPPTWFKAESGALFSIDPSTSPDRGLPSNSIKVDISSYSEDGTGCWPLRIDPETGEQIFTEPEAAPATVDGVSGAQVIRVFDPPEYGLTRVHGFSVIHKGYCFDITGYFVQDEPDEATFLQIVSSFRFGDFPAVDEKP